MGRKWSNLNLPGALHFVTGATLDRTPFFSSPKNCETFLEILGRLNYEWPSKLIAYVVMPDHVHLVCNPRDGRIKEFVGKLKSVSAKAIVGLGENRLLLRPEPRSDGSIHQVWQESFKALPIWSGWMAWQKINYIHANPVKAGLCKTAGDYRWSSFGAFYRSAIGAVPIDKDWSWPDDAEKLLKAKKELDLRIKTEAQVADRPPIKKERG